MPITVIDTKLDSVKLIEPRVFGDERGFFMESWNQRDFDSLVKPVNFIRQRHIAICRCRYADFVTGMVSGMFLVFINVLYTVGEIPYPKFPVRFGIDFR